MEKPAIDAAPAKKRRAKFLFFRTPLGFMVDALSRQSSKQDKSWSGTYQHPASRREALETVNGEFSEDDIVRLEDDYRRV
jgi:hypothetical protein